MPGANIGVGVAGPARSPFRLTHRFTDGVSAGFGPGFSPITGCLLRKTPNFRAKARKERQVAEGGVANALL